MTVGWLDHPAFDLHDAGAWHPEAPERLLAIREAIADASLGLDARTASAATEDDLRAVHADAQVDGIHQACLSGGGYLDPDTHVVEASWDAALRAAGAVMEAVDRVLQQTWNRAFCSVRPPGHHATSSHPMGFCLFNNVAIGAHHALNQKGVERVAILDWDVHHGNGTQDIFWARSDVLYVSTHQYPFFPGTGRADEVGVGPGKNATVNCPLPAGAGDSELLAAWDQRMRPALDAFGPDILMISAGFDADVRDPLAQLNVTARGFSELSTRAVRFAEEHCAGRIVSVLEGGYSLAALREDVIVHLNTLS